MSPLTTMPRRLAADAFETQIESAIIGPNDLYDLDGETVLRNRDGRVETGSSDAFAMEAF
jgi:hypothetical protein